MNQGVAEEEHYRPWEQQVQRPWGSTLVSFPQGLASLTGEVLGRAYCDSVHLLTQQEFLGAG